MAIFVGDNNDNFFEGTAERDLFIGRGGSDSFNGEAIFQDPSPDIAFGGAGDDFLHMGSGVNFADGGSGHDFIHGGSRGGSTLFGGGGRDEIRGSFDSDFIHGGAGRDRIDGQDGDDVLTGGAGQDVFEFEGDLRIAVAGVGDDIITDFKSGLDRIEIGAFSTPGLNTFEEVLANLANGLNGAVLTVPEGDHIEGTITFVGVLASELERSDFLFV